MRLFSSTNIARAALAVGALAGASGTALAATVVSATLDSTSFQATFSGAIGAGDGFDPSTQATFVYVYAPGATSDSASDWISPVSVLRNGTGSFYASGSAGRADEVATSYGSPSLVNVNRFAEFTLSAGESLTASIAYELTYAAIPATPAVPGQTAESNVQLQIVGLDPNGNYTNIIQSSDAFLDAAASPLDSTLSVSFTNSGLGAETFRLALNANTSITGVSAVPEPTTFAMMFAGVACLSLVTARRRRRI